jgi:hypothetical protein
VEAADDSDSDDDLDYAALGFVTVEDDIPGKQQNKT